MTDKLTRRDVIKCSLGVGAGIGAGLLPGASTALAGESEDTVTPRKRVLRFAHLTDIHVKPERGAGLGMAAALQHAQALDDPPEMIFTGGDGIMDALAATRSRTQQQWQLWNSILKNECSLPLQHCIGNHDIWGWSQKKSETTGDEPLWGKQWAIEAYGLDKSYRSFDQAGWHFIVLDSVQPRPQGGYMAVLDDEQFDWLAEDLAGVDAATPVIVISHIPIVSVTPAFFKDYFKDWRTQIPGSLLHNDMHRIKDLFYKHKNIKLCLSSTLR